MKRVYLDFTVDNVDLVEEFRVIRSSDNAIVTMRVFHIPPDTLEDAVRNLYDKALKIGQPNAYIYIGTIKDATNPRPAFALCLSPDVARMEVVEPRFVQPSAVREG